VIELPRVSFLAEKDRKAGLRLRYPPGHGGLATGHGGIGEDGPTVPDAGYAGIGAAAHPDAAGDAFAGAAGAVQRAVAHPGSAHVPAVLGAGAGTDVAVRINAASKVVRPRQRWSAERERRRDGKHADDEGRFHGHLPCSARLGHDYSGAHPPNGGDVRLVRAS